MFDFVITALQKNDKMAIKQALESEQELNTMQIKFRKSHVRRMTKGVCTPSTGVIFIDFVDNIEKVGDHLTNIAQSIAGGLQWRGVEPKINNS